MTKIFKLFLTLFVAVGLSAGCDDDREVLMVNPGDGSGNTGGVVDSPNGGGDGGDGNNEDIPIVPPGGDLTITWSSDVTAEQKEVLTALVQNMVYVEGGTFMMGANVGDTEAYEWEKPRHSVTLSSYRIGKYEVTQREWVAVMGNNPSKWIGDDLPVGNVSFDECQYFFIHRLNKMTGLNFRLPTEAEWEFAARGGNRSEGYLYSGSNTVGDVAWYYDNSGDKTHPVGQKLPNELGLYDMSGNVCEWCSDWYDGSYYSSSPSNNPQGPSSSPISNRVYRLGCLYSSAWGCRVSNREFASPSFPYNSYGLRLALSTTNDLPGEPEPSVLKLSSETLPLFSPINMRDLSVDTLCCDWYIRLNKCDWSAEIDSDSKDWILDAEKIDATKLRVVVKNVSTSEEAVGRKGRVIISAIADNGDVYEKDLIVVQDSIKVDLVTPPEGVHQKTAEWQYFPVGAVNAVLDVEACVCPDFITIMQPSAFNIYLECQPNMSQNYRDAEVILVTPLTGEKHIVKVRQQPGLYFANSVVELDYTEGSSAFLDIMTYNGTVRMGTETLDNASAEFLTHFSITNPRGGGLTFTASGTNQGYEDLVYELEVIYSSGDVELRAPLTVIQKSTTFTVDNSYLQFGRTPSEHIVNVSHSGATVECDADWLDVSIAEKVVTIKTVSEPEIEREAEVKLIWGEQSQIVKVVQNSYDVMIDDVMVTWSSDVTAEQKEVLTALVQNMVLVEGGTFMMGANSGDSDADNDEKPRHSVTLSGYRIGKYEVTQREWLAVMGSNPSWFKGDNLPVECVSWNDCQAFVQKLNNMTGLSFRLPTEAEWEFAARGGNRSIGYKYSGGDNIGSVAWYDGNSGSTTHPVGQKQGNELGLYDMSGNVYEWCSDWYDNDYYSSSPSTNPKGPSSGSLRVFRGGCWSSNAWICRVSYRRYDTPWFTYCYLGLRLAL